MLSHSAVCRRRTRSRSGSLTWRGGGSSEERQEPRRPSTPREREREKVTLQERTFTIPGLVSSVRESLESRTDQHKGKESDEQAVVKVSMDHCSVGEMKLLVGARGQRANTVCCHLCECIRTGR